MKNVFLFLPEVVRLLVDKGKTGVYALGEVVEDEFLVGYVGRSDTCLQTRLLTHNYLYDFSYFYFQCVETPADAYALEAGMWHACMDYGIPIRNRIHPDSPANAHLKCPYCQSGKMILKSLERNWPKAG